MCTKAVGTQFDDTSVIKSDPFPAHGQELRNIRGQLHFDGICSTSNCLLRFGDVFLTVTIKATFDFVFSDVRDNFSKLRQPLVDFFLLDSVFAPFYF